MAQQSLCPGDVANKRYWVTTTAGSTYKWVTPEAGATIVSGQGTNEVYVNWGGKTTGTATLTVQETNAGGCFGDVVTVTVTFAGPTAKLQGLDQNLCEPPPATGITVELTGSQPWSINYTLNGATKTISGITASPYTVDIAGMDYGQDYKVALTGVSDKECPGTVSGAERKITIYPRVNTSAIQFE